MPELHTTQPATGGLSPSTLDAASRWAQDDVDFALGCECADPSLQIDRWGQAEPQPDTD